MLVKMNSENPFRYDPDIGYTFIPDLQTRIPHEAGGYLIRTNSLGFRSNSTPLKKQRSSKRVFIFGDSFTAGDGVSNGKRYSDVLENSLPGVECYNFGLSGSGTDQQFIAYKKFAQKLSCDLVIVSVLVENIRRITSHYRLTQSTDGTLKYRAKPYFELDNDHLVRRNDPVPKTSLTLEQLQLKDPSAIVDRSGRFVGARKLVKSLGLQELAQKITRYQPVPDYDNAQSYGWRLMRAILLEWQRLCSCPILVVPLPLYQHIEQTSDASNYQQRFSELATEGEPLVHDVLPDLLKYSQRERRAFRFAGDVHLTPDGHEALAQSLIPIVSNLLYTECDNAANNGRP